ncbi:hypothetical protein E7681_11095 [Thalassobius vesicularis]|uniref:Uncharacterized protein n=1 Tax=Thalassobius vesicularis TaxID=1294297 RepID=A0A4S3M7C8_9RHOB|nr:hypothetical protein [Thalassobius vesicularis]THD73242.1 hypothetical protein E7681_11095 [Thalassobius vesicularis]
MRLFRVTKAVVLGLLLAGSLTLNVATVAFSSVALLVSSAYEAVTGAVSVAGGLRREVVSLSDEVATLKAPKSVTYRGQKRLLSEAVEDTAGRIGRRTAAGAARNAGSVVAEAIPFAGIAVVLGVTAWDLKDSCDTMKDLHELELAFVPGTEADPEATEVCGLAVPSTEEVWAAVRSSPTVAWKAAKGYLPDLPELSVPKIDWTFWD